jgi:hypothetical protein
MPGSEDASGVALWHAKAQQAGGILGTGPRAARHPLAGGKLELEIFGERVRQPRRESARAWRAPDDAGL